MDPAKALILLVDDDPDFVEINRHLLEAQGYRVTCAAEPAEALRKMEAERPDLVVSDLMMNRLDSGFSLAQRIKQDPRFGATPLILVTAVSSQFSLDFRPRSPEDLAAMHADARMVLTRPTPAPCLGPLSRDRPSRRRSAPRPPRRPR
jgi:CheY-like chemotaxis protein